MPTPLEQLYGSDEQAAPQDSYESLYGTKNDLPQKPTITTGPQKPSWYDTSIDMPVPGMAGGSISVTPRKVAESGTALAAIAGLPSLGSAIVSSPIPAATSLAAQLAAGWGVRKGVKSAGLGEGTADAADLIASTLLGGLHGKLFPETAAKYPWSSAENWTKGAMSYLRSLLAPTAEKAVAEKVATKAAKIPAFQGSSLARDLAAEKAALAARPQAAPPPLQGSSLPPEITPVAKPKIPIPPLQGSSLPPALEVPPKISAPPLQGSSAAMRPDVDPGLRSMSHQQLVDWLSRNPNANPVFTNTAKRLLGLPVP